MNTQELRAAAERLAGYNLADWQGATGECANMRAGIMLARDWIANHPADDDDGVVLPWLLAVGGAQVGQSAARFNATAGALTVWPNDKPGEQVLWIDNETHHVAAVFLPWDGSRGHLRRICSVIRIPLKEST